MLGHEAVGGVALGLALGHGRGWGLGLHLDLHLELLGGGGGGGGWVVVDVDLQLDFVWMLVSMFRTTIHGGWVIKKRYRDSPDREKGLA